jgi:hypothetical protein
MKGLRFRRPSAALVIAIIALLLSMIGTGYAAFELPKNSVGTKQLKKGSVTGAKVKKHTLTGDSINLKKLGTVPAAEVAASANSLAAPEAVHLVGAGGQPQFMGGSENYPLTVGGAHLQPVGFYKDHEGIVHLQGIAATGKTPIAETYVPVFQLPPGYRPTANAISLFANGGIGAALIAGANTNVKGVNVEGMVLGSKESSIVLEGITFRAES